MLLTNQHELDITLLQTETVQDVMLRSRSEIKKWREGRAGDGGRGGEGGN